MILRDVLPPIYKHLRLGEWLDFEIEEKSPTCDNCLMSRPERGKLPFYNAKLKCCTYHPFLPNYLLGAILEGQSTATFVHEVLKNKEQNKSYLLPIGALPPVRFQVLFNNREETDFGNRQDWLCPYFDKVKDQCGVWANRGATCSTYFCTSDYGKFGLSFWGSLFDLLNLIEIRLAEKALVELGFSEDEISGQSEYFDCTDGTEEEMKSDSMSQALWGHFWANRNDNVFEFYKQTHAIVAQLSQNDLKHVFKDQVFNKIESKVSKAYKKLAIL